MTQHDTFIQVHAVLGGERRKRGYIHTACPFCGKMAKRGQTHFSYNEDLFKCFVCGAQGGLSQLAGHLGLTDDERPVRYERPQPAPASRVSWWKADKTLLSRIAQRSTEHPDRVKIWQGYKPLTEETIVTRQLGVGRLPSDDPDRWSDWRLIMPVYEDGKVVALRGRKLVETGWAAKWLTYGGSYLYNIEQIDHRTLWVVENMADALMLMDRYPEWCAVAPTTGVASWSDEWTQRIAEACPDMVVIAYDRDEAGRTNAMKVANRLLATGLDVTIFRWPPTTPPKADIGWLLTEGGAA